jgi:O-acetylhomoserine/O-acetylserine sulfhydrylase-like pyridoxal-dependent enzyme
MEGKMTKSRLPKTDSIEEMARFWDTHDLTEFEDELEEVTESVFEETVPVPLEPQEIQAVRKIAESKGIDYRALIHEWVVEKLQSA